MRSEHEAKIVYRVAIRVALEHLRDSERVCAQIDAVAAGLNRRQWSWSTNPAAATRAA